MVSNSPTLGDDKPKTFKSKSTIGKIAESIAHPHRTLSRAKDGKVEKRREVLRVNISSPVTLHEPPEFQYDPDVQSSGIFGQLANEFPNNSGVPQNRFRVPVGLVEMSKLKEKTSLGMVAPERQRYQCTQCKKEIGFEFRGASVVRKYMCGSCRTKVQQGFV